MTTTNMPDDATAAENPNLIRTYRTRAYLSRAGHVQLDDVLAQQCLLYNAALEERTMAWKQHQQRYLVRRSRIDRSLRYASDFPEYRRVGLNRRVQVSTLRRLDRAFSMRSIVVCKLA